VILRKGHQSPATLKAVLVRQFSTPKKQLQKINILIFLFENGSIESSSDGHQIQHARR